MAASERYQAGLAPEQPLVGIPIKPFGIAKARLGPVLDAPARSRLGKAVALHALEAANSGGAEAVVVTDDAGVAAWSMAAGFGVLGESNGGLDGAGRAVVEAAGGRRRWAVVHADLPLITREDVAALLAAVPTGGVAIAPARDGGTAALAGDVDRFEFSYGVGSAQRHLRRARHVPIHTVCRPGLALDLDTPADLAAAVAHEHGGWLQAVLAA